MRVFPAAILGIVLLGPGWGGALGSPSRLQQGSTPNSVSTKQIKVDLIVTDGNNRSVDDVKAEDLEVTVDGEPQKITYFAKVEEPLIYMVSVDTSQSFAPLLAKALTAVRLLFEGNRPGDETMLVRFISSDQLETIQEFTADKSTLLNVALNEFAPGGGQSAILDAVYVSVETTAKYKPTDLGSRRAVVLISDGEDRISYYDRDKVTKLLREQRVQLFVIGIVSKLSDEGGIRRPSPRAKAERLLTDLTKESGGRVFFCATQEEMLEAAGQIVSDLQAQYVVVFDRTVPPNKKGFEKFKIKIADSSIRKNLKIITRSGYWLTPPETKKKK